MSWKKLCAVLAIGLACGGVRAGPGDDCAAPLVVTLPADLPFVDQNQHTCGRGNLYDGTNTCLGGFADGEEIIYQLQVTSPIEVEITLDPNGQSWTAVVLSSNCPPAGDGCLAYCADDTSQPRVLDCRYLGPGTYTLMVDCWPIPAGRATCIPSFDLSIVACALPHGACCVESACIGTLPAAACAASGGIWYEGFDCATFACPVEIAALPETCPAAYPIASVPFSATLETYFASGDGPPGSCNAPGTTVMQNDVWFTYTPAQDAVLNLTVQCFYYDGLTVVYAGPNCQTLSELSCLNSGGPGDPAVDTLSLTASAGTTYWFQIGDHGLNPYGGPTLLALSGTAVILTGDANCNGSVGFDDINPFVLLLSNLPAWQTEFPGCPILTGDINGDGEVNFDDINPFVALLSGRRAPARTR